MEATLPVIFHIVYNSVEARVSEDQVLSQIEALNRDFRHTDREIHHPADTLEGFAGKAADTGISFCLAAVSLGGGVPGIHYVRSQVVVWHTDDAIKSSKLQGADAFDPDHYINVWVAPLDGGASGYAQMPGGLVETDGIVIDYRFLGIGGSSVAPYNEGKTLTHLMGNYLGLYDIWGPGHCKDDYVDDTPIHNAPNYNMPTSGERHISLCPMGPIDEMWMNFMDNTDDLSLNMFTYGQKTRMEAMLSGSGPRAGLKESSTVCFDVDNIAMGDDFLRGKSIYKANGDNKLQLYPNPTRGSITIKLEGEAASAVIHIYNSFGVNMHSVNAQLEGKLQTVTANCEIWPPGLYFVNVLFSDETKLNSVFSIVR